MWVEAALDALPFNSEPFRQRERVDCDAAGARCDQCGPMTWGAAAGCV